MCTVLPPPGGYKLHLTNTSDNYSSVDTGFRGRLQYLYVGMFQIKFQDPWYRSRLVTMLRTGPSGFEYRHVQQILLFLHSCRKHLGATQPSAQWITSFFFPGVHRPTCGVGILPLTSTEIKKVWSYTPVPPPIRLHRVDRENFPFDFV